MSIVRCEFCQKNIDTDFDAEHFIPDTEHCLIQVEEAAPDLLGKCKIALEVLKDINENHDVPALGIINGLEQAINKATKELTIKEYIFDIKKEEIIKMNYERALEIRATENKGVYSALLLEDNNVNGYGRAFIRYVRSQEEIKKVVEFLDDPFKRIDK